MSEEENAADKEHEASQKKLEDAREKGEIPRSPDIITAAAYCGLLVSATLFGETALLHTASALSGLLAQSDRIAPLFMATGTAAASGFIASVVAGIAPLFLLPAFAALIAVIAQRALIFTLSKVAPKSERISPLSGFQNKFGRKGLFEFAKSLTKLIVVSLILGIFLTHRANDILNMMYLTPAMSVAMLMRQIIRFLSLVVLVAMAIGGIDYFWQRAEHFRSNRMSRKEVMDEQKNAEGDPHLKAKRRQKGQDIAMNKMLVDVAGADVVIVNPTHYAVALKWDKGAGRAPVCVAKGVDEIAARIREKAIEAAVPLHPDPPVARILHASLRIGDEIAPDHYKAVAAAIRFAEKMRQRSRSIHVKQK